MTSFRETGASGGARCGTLTLPSGAAVATPAPLLYTRAGAPPHLTADAAAALPQEARLLGINACAFLGDVPSAAAVAAAGGAARFVGLPGAVIFASQRDPACYEAPLRRANDAGIAAGTAGGLRRVTPAGYAAALAALRCDAAVALADEVAPTERPKRVRAAAERTQRWLGELCAAAGGAGAGGIWASLQGGALPEERARAAAAAAAHAPPVAGFSLGGLGAGEAPAERPALLAASLQPLPPAAPRHAAGLSAPDEVLQAAACGVDLFDGVYPHLATLAGCALVFPVGPEDAAAAGDACAPFADGFKASLRAPCFRADTRPLLPGCACFACARHTRCAPRAQRARSAPALRAPALPPLTLRRRASAYLHHLLDAHEMLGEVLLDLHNQHHYLRFFAALRAAIAADAFPAFDAFHAAHAQAARAAAAEAAATEAAAP